MMVVLLGIGAALSICLFGICIAGIIMLLK